MSSEVQRYITGIMTPVEMANPGPASISARQTVVVTYEDYAALEAENARLTAQLAAIQGGMGEAVEDWDWLANLELAEVKCCCPWNPDGHDESCPVYLRDRLSDAKRAIAQHQRITAAMAAEVERLKQQIDNYRSQFCELHIARNLLSRLSRAGFEIGDDLAASIIALRAELAEVKGREAVPVAWMDEDGCLHTTLESATFRRRPVTPLYTTPPASPDVEGLCRLLAQAQGMVNGATDQWHDEVRDALSTWRQTQEGKP